MRFKHWIRRVAPPILLDLYRHVRQKPIWEGVFPSFRDVRSGGPGFNEADYLPVAMARHVAAVASSKRTIPIDVVNEHAFLPLLSAVVCDRNGGTLRVLDYGGGLGTSYVRLLSSLRKFSAIDYHVVELDWARQAAPPLHADDGQIHFHSAIPDDLKGVDIVYLNGVLMYIDDYASLLKDLCAIAPAFVFVTDLAAGSFPTFASAQRHGASIIPHWFFNIDEIVEIMSREGYCYIFTAAFVESHNQNRLPAERRLDGGRASAHLFSRRNDCC